MSFRRTPNEWKLFPRARVSSICSARPVIWQPTGARLSARYDFPILQFLPHREWHCHPDPAAGWRLPALRRQTVPGSRPGEDLGMHLKIGLRRRRPSYRTGRNGSFAAQSEFAGEQFFSATLIHYQHDQVGLGSADLEAHAAAFDADRPRRRPSGSISLPAGHIAFAKLSTDQKGRGFHPGNNDDATGVRQQVLRDAFVRCRHHLGEHCSGFVQPLSRLGKAADSRGTSAKVAITSLFILHLSILGSNGVCCPPIARALPEPSQQVCDQENYADGSESYSSSATHSPTAVAVVSPPPPNSITKQ